MAIKEAIILAGGLGTRLRSAVPDLPKCMAPVAGKPFLHYVIAHCQQQGIEKFIFSLGYMHEHIESYLKEELPTNNYQLSIEEEPLGTGGAIRLACTKSKEQNLLALNGDTLFKINFGDLAHLHESKNAHCTLSLKPMRDFDRYGVVELNEDESIQRFQEKKYYESGMINGGIYALKVSPFLENNFPEKFSFEKDYLEKYYQSRPMYGLAQDAYFIDIGIPSDFERAQTEVGGVL
jgi:D-glycero-alpha-D-manno-heptose 1-phosphate guanylyltransferase